MLATILKYIAIMICLSTASGMVIHDLRIDKATVTAMMSPETYANYTVGNKLVNFSDAHTHVERSAFSQSIDRQPMISNRFNETKKHLMQKYSPRGHHAFDNYNLPLI